MSYVTYLKEEEQIIESGIENILKVLMGQDSNKKRSLLFCLDKYLDDYFKDYCVKYENEILNLLQFVIITPNDIKVIEDAIDLLTSYSDETYSFEILEKNLNLIPENFKSDIKYIISKKC